MSSYDVHIGKLISGKRGLEDGDLKDIIQIVLKDLEN
jgi:hypothetical protein